MMVPISNDPDYVNKLSYINFLKLTEHNNVSQFAKGSSLEKLVGLAENAGPTSNLNLTQRHGAFNPDKDQTHLEYLSKVKQRLAKAIEMKRAYYDNHPFGIITKYFLMCFDRWNNGDTAAIISAENFLLLWDSRKPIYFNPSCGKYIECKPFLLESSNVKDFYNYNPRREIELQDGTKINYTNLKN